MSKTAVTTKRKSGKALNAANLKALGSERLAALVLELADDHPAAKRLLRLALAGESSAEDLAAEIDKRLETIGQSQARVSWRRYREFVRDLELHRSAIAGRLAELDPNLALTLAGCEKPGGQAGQTNKPVNVAQDSAGAATGLATAAAGAVSSSAFVRDAAMGDMYEIEAAKIALARSKSAEVKSMARMILDDHTAASDKMKALVAAGTVKETLPTELDERRKGMLDNLRGSGGTDFDGRYIKQQVAGHHEAFALMTGYKAVGQDAALKAFAAEVEPKIKMHLDMAQKLAGEAVGHTGKDTAAPASPAQ